MEIGEISGAENVSLSNFYSLGSPGRKGILKRAEENYKREKGLSWVDRMGCVQKRIYPSQGLGFAELNECYQKIGNYLFRQILLEAELNWDSFKEEGLGLIDLEKEARKVFPLEEIEIVWGDVTGLSMGLVEKDISKYLKKMGRAHEITVKRGSLVF